MSRRTEKIEEVVSYLTKLGEPKTLDQILKMVWRSDQFNFRLHGETITGLDYVVENQAAVSKELIQLIDSKSISIENGEDGLVRFTGKSPDTDNSKLSPRDESILQLVFIVDKEDFDLMSVYQNSPDGEKIDLTKLIDLKEVFFSKESWEEMLIDNEVAKKLGAE